MKTRQQINTINSAPTINENAGGLGNGSPERMEGKDECAGMEAITDAQWNQDREVRERSRKVRLQPGEHLRIVAVKAKGGTGLIGVTAIYDPDLIESVLIETAPAGL